MPAYADLCYLMVNGKPLNGVGDLAISSKINNVQCQANFLTEHHKKRKAAEKVVKKYILEHNL